MTDVGKDRAVVPIQVLLKRVLPLGVLVAVVVTLFGSFAVAHAAGSVTFQDNAGLFTAAGRSRIAQAAQNANEQVKVLTTDQSFSSASNWHSYVQQNGGGSGTVTIGLGLHVIGQKNVFVYPDPSTNISQSQADQAFTNAKSTFNSGNNSATSNGVIAIIQNLPGAATAPGGVGAPAAAPSRGIGGVLVPLIIIVLLAFVLMRVLGRRRRNTVMPGYGPGYGQPPMGQGPYNQGQGGYPNQGNRGGGFGRGLLGGVAGGLAGSFIGNEIFGNRGGDGGNANAAGPDAGANAPGDTANAQDQQGGWGGDSGGGADAGGGWGGDSGGGWGGDVGRGGDVGGGGDSGGGWS